MRLLAREASHILLVRLRARRVPQRGHGREWHERKRPARNVSYPK